ncbi:MAG: hypothetical protein HOE48_18110 [Candidatus Latescibacteria bacterium]|nr:hypothetical protein [Candidatus Latescibacterota bacterium]
MMRLFLFSVLMCFCTVHTIEAQLSPGELARVHAHLEGLSNCTQCHQLGQHIDGAKCMDCHTEIRVRINADKGFHATVRDTNCVSCHSDHNGQKFSMIRWPDEDMTHFDHNRTGYVLRGKKHQEAECRDCHQEKNIRASDILTDRKGSLDHTFLGLDQACSSCHVDKHKGQFDQSCDACHVVDDWKVIDKFSHDQARFALVGKHDSTACEKCHLEEPLVGEPTGSFTRFRPLVFDGCVACHEDVHFGKFAQTCEQCHSPNGWYETNLKTFNHNQTKYPLVGKHDSVKCELCHGNTEKLVRPAFAQCVDCHQDTHQGQLRHRVDKGRCESCHIEQGFMPARFGLERHQDTRFRLEGAHQAVPCMMCHQTMASGVVQFVWPQETFTCRDCHQTPHGDQFVARIAKGGCEACHNGSTWHAVDVNHNETRFPLRGKHQKVFCEKCHKGIETDGFTGTRYVPLPLDCQDCHVDQHGSQFDRADITACVRCHTTGDWKPTLFDHNKDALFAITGAHEDVACEKCHQVEAFDLNIIDRRYKPLDRTCAACHGEMKGR